MTAHGTAGGMMTTQFVSVHATDTVGEVIEVLRELPEEWLFCIFELWHYVYPGVYGAEHSTENCTDAVLLKWIADDAFNGGWSPCHWWLDCYLTGSQYHVQWPTAVEWPSH